MDVDCTVWKYSHWKKHRFLKSSSQVTQKINGRVPGEPGVRVPLTGTASGLLTPILYLLSQPISLSANSNDAGK